MSRKFLHLLGIMLMAAAAPALAQNTVKIGAINPYSGPVALYGDETTRGYELAAEWQNRNGGLLGKQVEIIRGNATSPQEAIGAVEQLSGKVDAFIGTYISAVSNAASESALSNGKLYWDTNALATQLTDRGLPNFIRSGAYALDFAARTVDGVTDVVAKALGKDPKSLTVWIQHEDSIYGTTIAKEQERRLKEAGVQVLSVNAYSAKAIDQNDLILRARNANPDVFISTGYTGDSNLMMRTARDQGFKPKATIFVGTGDTFETLDALGKEYLDGILIVTFPRPDMNPAYAPGGEKFLQEYRAKYNRDPIAPQCFTAYVGAKIMFKAIQLAGATDFESVRKAAAKMDDPVGTYDNGYGVKFDAKFQNTRAAPIITQWQNGKQVTVYPLPAALPGTKLLDLARK